MDGDGRLDLVGTQFHVGDLTDEYGNYIKQKFKIGIFKINLERDLHTNSLKTKHVQATVSSKMPKVKTATALEDLRFRKWKKQPWREYMGSKGDSIYKS